jgi:hypothetical protein
VVECSSGFPPNPLLGLRPSTAWGGQRAAHGGGMHGPVRAPTARSGAGRIGTSGSSRRGPPRGHHGRCRFAQAWAVIGAVTRAVGVALAWDVAGGGVGTTVPDATTGCGSRWRSRGAEAEDLPSPETQKAPSTEVEEASMARIALRRAPVSSEHGQYMRREAFRQEGAGRELSRTNDMGDYRRSGFRAAASLHSRAGGRATSGARRRRARSRAGAVRPRRASGGRGGCSRRRARGDGRGAGRDRALHG